MHHVPITRVGITSDDEGFAIMSRVVVRDNTLYLCGVVPESFGDIVSQTRQVLAKIDAMLTANGSDRSKTADGAGLARRHESFHGDEQRVECVGRSEKPAGPRLCAGRALPTGGVGGDYGDGGEVVGSSG